MKVLVTCLLRMAFVGGASLAMVLYQIDNYLKSEYGVVNIYMLVFFCSFIPVLVTLTIELYSWHSRVENRKRKNNTVYLKETITKKPLTR